MVQHIGVLAYAQVMSTAEVSWALSSVDHTLARCHRFELIFMSIHGYSTYCVCPCFHGEPIFWGRARVGES